MFSNFISIKKKAMNIIFKSLYMLMQMLTKYHSFFMLMHVIYIGGLGQVSIVLKKLNLLSNLTHYYYGWTTQPTWKSNYIYCYLTTKLVVT